MASTYDPIQSYTLGSAQATVTFSSIPQTYTDLVLVCKYGANSGNSAAGIRFNGDSSNSYSNVTLVGKGTGSPISDRATSATFGYFAFNITASSASGNDLLSVIEIGNYTSSSVNKTALAITQCQTSTYPGVEKELLFWLNTSAINTILLDVRANTFNAGSTFTLYGIKAA